MWLVFDIGNSSIKGGLFDGKRLYHTFVLPHAAAELATALDVELDAAARGRAPDRAAGGEIPTGTGRQGLHGTSEVRRSVIARAGIASVVPETTHRLSRLLRSRGLDVTVIDHTMHLPFELAYRTPETLGTDRLAAAAAGWTLFGKEHRQNVVALDAGTALTYEVIDRRGIYLGGTIAPGPALMQRALSRETAQLPDVPLELPEEPIGRSTTEAIQAGVMYGFVESVKGLLRRIDDCLGEESFVVATGGWSRLLHENLDEVDAVDAHLVLRGIRILMTLND